MLLALPGLTILALLQTVELQNKWSDKIPLVIELKKTYSIDSFQLLKNFLESKSEFASIEFHTKEEAHNSMISDHQLNLNDSLIDNPFRDVFLMNTDEAHVSIDKIKEIKSEIQANAIVESIEIGEKLKSEMSATLSKLQLVLGLLSILLSLLSFFIINYLVRLNFERKIDLVKNIYLIGGSPEQAYAPFKRNGLRMGLASSLLSVVFLGIGLLCLFIMVPSLFQLINIKNFILVMLILGILGPTLHLLKLKKLISQLFKS